jgi:hypothetical protein
MKKNECVLDIETRKVETPLGYTMPNGEVMRRRWRPFLIGLGFADDETILVGQDDPEQDEKDLLFAAWQCLWYRGIKTIYYGASRREFDEMVLKGRFTNARRAHLPEPGPWPHLKDAEKFRWVNLGAIPKVTVRKDDILSQDVPDAWAKGYRTLVLDHLRWDLDDLRAAVAAM